MKLIPLKCPHCDAIAKVKPGSNMLYCPYCGGQIFFDDGVKRKESYSKIESTHQRTNISVDVAKIRESDNEKDIQIHKMDNKKNILKMIFLGYLILLGICAGLSLVGFIIYTAYTHFSNRYVQNMQEQGMIRAKSHTDYEGQNYKAVVAQLEAIGFTNIETIDLDDANFFLHNEDKVNDISIAGNYDFSKDDFFNPDDAIIITYH